MTALLQLRHVQPSCAPQAATALAKLAHNNEEMRAAISSMGGVLPIIKQLASFESGSGLGSDHASLARTSPAESSRVRGSQVKAGFVKSSCEGERTPESVLVAAATALANLAVEPSTRDEIVRGGGIPPLVRLLQGSTHPHPRPRP